MIRRSFLLILVGCLLAGCAAAPAPTEIPVDLNGLTARALTPTLGPTEEPEETPTVVAAEDDPTTTPEATEEPDDPTATPRATEEPDEATPTPEQATLAELSYCHQTFGATTAELFSARLNRVGVDQQAGREQVVLDFDVQNGRLGGMAGCITPEAATLAVSDEISSVLRLELPRWIHDQAWEESSITLTLPVGTEGAQLIENVTIFPKSDSSSGMVVEVGLNQAVPYAVDINNSQIIVSFGTTPELGEDPLGTDRGQPERPTQPFVFTQAGEIWILDGDRVRALSSTLEVESSIALSPDGTQIAFCRASPDTLVELGALWVSNIDGTNEQLVADVGGCLDPAWSFDGSALWFSAPWSAIQPFNYRLWEVELASGTPEPRSELDIWSRTQAHPLPQGEVVVFASDGQGTQTVLLLRDGVYTNLGSELLTQYRGIAEMAVTPDGTMIAVSALRASGGTDLVILNLDGEIEDVYGTTQWWNRPLAWTDDNQLYYLTTICEAGQVLSYELHLLEDQDELLAEGMTLAAIGDTTTLGEQLLYVRESIGTAAMRGPTPTVSGPSALWIIDPQGERLELLSTVRAITSLQ